MIRAIGSVLCRLHLRRKRERVYLSVCHEDVCLGMCVLCFVWDGKQERVSVHVFVCEREMERAR